MLHDAFFKFQSKPRMTKHGDVYYEGKEHEAHLREKRPGQISAELASALDIPAGGPPPWLVNMQRYGPPPSCADARLASSPTARHSSCHCHRMPPLTLWAPLSLAQLR